MAQGQMPRRARAACRSRLSPRAGRSGRSRIVAVSPAPPEFELDHDALLQIALLASTSSLPVVQIPQGLRVERAAPESLLAQAGLRAGDLITHVNGAETARGAWIQTAYDSLRQTSAVVLRVQRDGAEQTLRYRLRSGATGPACPEASGAPTEGVTRIDDRTVEVSRTFIDGLLEDQAKLMRLTRVVPFQRDGKVVGYKLFGIRSSSPLSALGIRNGDVLLGVNGVSVTDSDGLLERYVALRRATSITLELERQGAPLQLHVRIAER